MARMPRIVIPGEPLHIMHRGNNRQDIYQCDEDYERFLTDLKSTLKKYACDLHAYVLMSNHFHFLLTPHTDMAISGLMQSIGRHYVRYVNEKYSRTGTLWEGRFKSSLIDSERYLMTCYRYIEENPVRAGMVDTIEDYRWSSYHHNALGAEDDLITPHPIYDSLAKVKDNRPFAYRKIFARPLNVKTIELVNHSAEKGDVLGDEGYHKRIQRLIGRTTMKGHHGGDRKSESFKNLQI